jgi:lipopolysaccharide/colanic/teichoic acid biosynthesis glycosyltransferase
MAVDAKLISSSYDWIKKYDPDKRILSPREYAVAKRILDLALTILAAPVWLPLLGLVALGVAITSPGGPVFFRQNRTMVPNAEALKAKYAHLNELKWPDFKITNDPRITPLGRILRKTSLDELPQLINVLRGEMSLVGPRPTSYSAETYSLWHTARLDVLPGVTGLWQVTFRSAVDWDNKSRLDIAYVDRRCMMMDLEILLRTIPMVLNARGAR